MDIHSNISSVPARAYMFLPNISSLYATLLVFKIRLFNNGLSPEFWLKSSHLSLFWPLLIVHAKKAWRGKSALAVPKVTFNPNPLTCPVSVSIAQSHIFIFSFVFSILIWSSMAFHGHPWSPMAFHGNSAITKTASTRYLQKSHHHADIQTIQSARQNARKNARQIDQSIWALTNFVKWDSVLILLLLQCSHKIIKFWELKSKEEKILATIFWSLQMW